MNKKWKKIWLEALHSGQYEKVEGRFSETFREQDNDFGIEWND